MNQSAKWIGGTTAAVALALTAGVLVGRSGSSTETPAKKATVAQAARPSPKPVIADARTAAPARAPTPDPAPQPFVIKRILPIKGAIKYGEWHWDDAGVPPGPIVVTVDLAARVMSVFKGGYEIGATAVMLGTDDHPTPLGVFPILTKERYNTSSLYGDAPMPWTLRLTNDGVAIHGGHPVEKGFASHGCIGTPNGFVSKLFAIAHPGDKVIITRGKFAGVGSPLI